MSDRLYIRTGDDPVLKRVCDPVAPGEPMPWLDTFKRICRKARNPAAAGLGAPQVGVSKRVILTNVAGANGTVVLRAMINPAIIWASPETTVATEGCLSYPGKAKAIRRHNMIDVVWENERRQPVRGQFNGFEARVIQHEIDHLNGVCRVGDDSPPDAPEAQP